MEYKMNDYELRQYLRENPKYGFEDDIEQWLDDECIFSRSYFYYSRKKRTLFLSWRKRKIIRRNNNGSFYLYDDHHQTYGIVSGEDPVEFDIDKLYNRAVRVYDIGFNEWLIEYHYPYNRYSGNIGIKTEYFIVPKDKKWNIKWK